MTGEEYKQLFELTQTIKKLNFEKKFEEKVPYLQQGLKIDPENTYFLSNMGLYYKDNQEYEKAYQYFRKCIEIEENDKMFAKNLIDCLVFINKMPDKQEKKLLKKMYNDRETFTIPALILVEKCIMQEEPIDMTLLLFYLSHKVKLRLEDSEELTSLLQLCDKNLPNLKNNSISLSILEQMFYIALQAQNREAATNYRNQYELFTLSGDPAYLNKRTQKLARFDKHLTSLTQHLQTMNN